MSFRIQSFVDADCQTSAIEGEPGAAALDAIPGQGNVTIPELMGRSYVLTLGYTGSDIVV